MADMEMAAKLQGVLRFLRENEFVQVRHATQPACGRVTRRGRKTKADLSKEMRVENNRSPLPRVSPLEDAFFEVFKSLADRHARRHIRVSAVRASLVSASSSSQAEGSLLAEVEARIATEQRLIAEQRPEQQRVEAPSNGSADDEVDDEETRRGPPLPTGLPSAFAARVAALADDLDAASLRETNDAEDRHDASGQPQPADHPNTAPDRATGDDEKACAEDDRAQTDAVLSLDPESEDERLEGSSHGGDEDSEEEEEEEDGDGPEGLLAGDVSPGSHRRLLRDWQMDPTDEYENDEDPGYYRVEVPREEEDEFLRREVEGWAEELEWWYSSATGQAKAPRGVEQPAVGEDPIVTGPSTPPSHRDDDEGRRGEAGAGGGAGGPGGPRRGGQGKKHLESGAGDTLREFTPSSPLEVPSSPVDDSGGGDGGLEFAFDKSPLGSLTPASDAGGPALGWGGSEFGGSSHSPLEGVSTPLSPTGANVADLDSAATALRAWAAMDEAGDGRAERDESAAGWGVTAKSEEGSAEGGFGSDSAAGSVMNDECTDAGDDEGGSETGKAAVPSSDDGACVGGGGEDIEAMDLTDGDAEGGAGVGEMPETSPEEDEVLRRSNQLQPRSGEAAREGAVGGRTAKAAGPPSSKSGEEEVLEPQQDPDSDPKHFITFNLRVVHRVKRTGFEEHKDFPVVLGSVVAGRYQLMEYLGSAAFSKAVQALDMQTGMLVCLKIIKNNKDYFDQSLDEVKLLKYVNQHDPADAKGVLRLYDYFYHREHLFIVTELLRSNLYEFQKFNLESGDEPYFTLATLRSIARQVLTSLDYLHSLDLIHCDLKPENILIKSYSRREVKVIDLGSSCFVTDHLSSYVQSRSYRAPEVILGARYSTKVDIWGLGCILAELHTGEVLFQNDSLASLLARCVGIVGPFDPRLLARGRYSSRFFTRSGLVYERDKDTGALHVLQPKKSTLASRLGLPFDGEETGAGHEGVGDGRGVGSGDSTGFVDLLLWMLQPNPDERPTAAEVLTHPWLSAEHDGDVGGGAGATSGDGRERRLAAQL